MDKKDDDALNRRLAVRAKHLELLKQGKEAGIIKFAAVLLDENEKMIGSSKIVEMGSKEEVAKWLEHDPYAQNNVWDFSTLKITGCKIGDLFK
jgi:uncharacterized protein YciI